MASPTIADVATSAWLAVAPITSERPFISMASSPSIWERSTRCGGLASRCFMTGTSVLPPEINLASSFFTMCLSYSLHIYELRTLHIYIHKLKYADRDE